MNTRMKVALCIAAGIPAGLLLCCCLGGIGFVAYRNLMAAPENNNPSVANAPEKADTAGEKDNTREEKAPANVPDKEPGKMPEKAPEKSEEKRPDLTVIFLHTPNRSVAKMVKRGSPIPPGWAGGPGRTLSVEIYQRELQLSALLANSKEGETAALTK